MQVPQGKKFSLSERLRSFRFAFTGILLAIRTQHNFRIHLTAFALVIASGFIFGISAAEWCIILLASALVLSLEIINTAMEFLVDLLSPEYHEKAGFVKDLSAAAVLISSAIALVCGLIIFAKYILALFISSPVIR
ncbi:MAG: diacylglycerol kinase family protein [Bacteroidetes bacterium]|nr:MAG: diacylglycerol kinase family protein [Bacteroidota bacterium]